MALTPLDFKSCTVIAGAKRKIEKCKSVVCGCVDKTAFEEQTATRFCNGLTLHFSKRYEQWSFTFVKVTRSMSNKWASLYNHMRREADDSVGKVWTKWASIAQTFLIVWGYENSQTRQLISSQSAPKN
eukprot:1885628-Amphidinium_carterae.1